MYAGKHARLLGAKLAFFSNTLTFMIYRIIALFITSRRGK